MDEMLELLLEWGWDWVDFKYSEGACEIIVGMEAWFTSDLYTARIMPTGKGTTMIGAWEDLKKELSEVSPNVIIPLGEQALRAVTTKKGINQCTRKPSTG